MPAGVLLASILGSHGLAGRLLGRYGYAAVFSLVGIESVGVPLPGETALIAASLYAGATHNLTVAGIVIAAAAGAIIGDNIGFALGHWGGYRLLERYGRRIHIDEKRIRLGRYLFMKHGGKVVFFGRFVSVLRTYAAFLAGTNRMPWPRFLAFNAAGGILWSLIYGVVPYVLGSQAESLSRPVDIVLAVFAVVVIVTAIVRLRRNEARLQAEADRALGTGEDHAAGVDLSGRVAEDGANAARRDRRPASRRAGR